MVSQSALVAFLNGHKDAIGNELLQRAVTQIGGTKPDFVFSVSLHTKVLEVFRFLLQTRVGGCAVVDVESRLIGNVSISDVVFSAKEGFGSANVEEFIKGNSHRHFPIKVAPSATVGEFLGVVAQAHVYRAYVTDAERHVQGVVTLSDVVEWVVEQLDQVQK